METYDLSHGGADNAIETVRIMDAERFNFPNQLAHQFATKMEEHAIRANEVENGIIRPKCKTAASCKDIIRYSIRRNSADRYAYENISSASS